MESTGGREGVCRDWGEPGVAARRVPEDVEVKFVCNLEHELLRATSHCPLFLPHIFLSFTFCLPDDFVAAFIFHHSIFFHASSKSV